MNDDQLNQAIMALWWEDTYRKRFNGDESISCFFLAAAEELDKDIAAAIEYTGGPGCSILDIGTGTGEQAICLAQSGYQVTATDISVAAIGYARNKAASKNVQVNFLVDNILATNLNELYEIVVDRGCYELLNIENAALYLLAVRKLIKPGGWLIMKTDCKKRKIKLLKQATGFNVVKLDAAVHKRLDGKTGNAIMVVAQKITG